MDRGSFKIILAKRQWEALKDVSLWYIRNTSDHEDEHARLLHEENILLYKKFKKKIENIETEGELKLNGAEALAFCQLFGSFSPQNSPYAYTIIRKVIDAIDKFRKSPIPFQI